VVRLAIILLTRRWGLIAIGLILIIAGLIYGLSSHSVSYITVKQETIAHILSGGGTGYLQLQSDSQLYIIHQSDFTPAIDDSTFTDGDVITFVYRPDQTTSIDETATNSGAHLKGDAFTVEQITATDSNGNQQTFTNSEYSQNPGGFYDSNWLPGGLLLLAGLIIGGAAFVMPVVRKPKTAYGITPPGGMGMDTGLQSSQPYQQPDQEPSPYNQPYPDTVPSYDGPAPSGQYDPTQPYNPYPNQAPQE